MKLILSIEVGNKLSKVALINQYGELQLNFIVEHDLKIGLIENLHNKIIKDIKKVGYDINDIYEKIGIAIPGFVDHSKGVVKYAGILNLNNFPLKEKAEELFKKEVLVLNDANAAALGEFWIGSAKRFDSIIFYTINDGVGGALILDGKLIAGSRGFAGEFGHGSGLFAKNSQHKCVCGANGCIEKLCSSTSIINFFKEFLSKDEPSLKKHFHDEDDIKLIDIYNVYKKNIGSEKIIEFLTIILDPLIRHISLMINALDPEAIIFSGEITELKDLLIKIIQNNLKKYVVLKFYDGTPIKIAELENDAILIGSAYYVLNDWKIT
ncbi:ROK family protein [Spiroplasma tabanidicola]|uniref:Glucokinase n=1 Tax=Spiroplasma tabanidicola TaxID=324079 RepID=A0A6I6C514_9MOLU|nr:ROK family protein [Spiroplasma tabanidicola]QGS51927.1 glucokinase [Spiroplasma tabanidicola]